MDVEGEEQQQHGGVDQAFSPEEKPSATEKAAPSQPPSLDIWPPSQRTRDAVISRLVETLSTPSVLSKRYGTLTHDEAADSARFIEESAFSSASALDQTLADTIDGQIEILQIYSKEISKRVIESLKAKSTAAAVSASPVISDTTAEEMSPPPPAPSAPATAEDRPTAETETPAS